MLLLASDYDGTLAHGGVVPEYNRLAVARFREQGNIFGVVTGRGREMLHVLKKNDVTADFVLGYNGAIWMNGDGQILREFTFDNADGKIHNLYEHTIALGGHGMGCFQNDNFYSFNPEKPCGDDYHTPLAKLDDITDNVNMVNCFFPDSAKALALADYIKQAYSTSLQPLCNNTIVDIPPYGVNKGIALGKYADSIGIKKSDIYTIGDAMNDYHMVSSFNGYAMASGNDELKRSALGIVETEADLIEMLLKNQSSD